MKILCHQFEDLLSDYLDDSLDSSMHREAAAHSAACPVCHDLLTEVKAAMKVCRKSALADQIPAPSPTFAARILEATQPDAAMQCNEFQDLLTDYLDGFLPATVFHRWERHAVVCQECTDLPGEVVRSIAVCYTAKADELPLPIGLHERILETTLGTVEAKTVKMSLGEKIKKFAEDVFQPIFSPVFTPQFASVAFMVMIAFVVFTNAVSPDGSISGIYAQGAQLAAQTYEESADAVESNLQFEVLTVEPPNEGN